MLSPLTDGAAVARLDVQWETLMRTLSDVFEHTLKDMYYAENAIVKALPEVVDAVSNADLKAALKAHHAETKSQVATLKKVFKSIGVPPAGEKCDAIDGLIKECSGVIDEAKGAAAKHAGIIGCCQAIEHYEIARYGTLRRWAELLGVGEAADLLTETLEQEERTDELLTKLAETEANAKARSGGA